MDGLTQVLNSRVQFGFDLFSKSFEDVLPLPPPGQPYYVKTQDTSVNYVTPDGKFYVRSL